MARAILQSGHPRAALDGLRRTRPGADNRPLEIENLSDKVIPSTCRTGLSDELSDEVSGGHGLDSRLITFQQY
ncbi:hypothetical protein PGTUg99_021391 [Puccinia graminis f. sp. tritici]|uniref:Uncharacterized protein n=1 Tax=Puccinia graminis f. sp. tritici TaxID=56615 RepID=A0A5B0RDW3_PUCGR|nr:hypothetical protein PGTUg99_021391 [Puccinia graminis f. sp. tritici]